MSQSTTLGALCPVNGIRGQLRKESGLPFAELVPARLINAVSRRINSVFRERIFTPAVTLWTFLSQVLDHDHTCRQAVARLLAYRTAHGLSRCSADTGAYCKARARLPEEILAQLTRHTGARLARQAPARWLWNGRPVKVVDGTGLSMPDTPKNAKKYPKSENFRPGMGFPVMRLVVIFNLAVGTVLDAAFGPAKGKGTGELTLFRQLANQFQRGDVLLGDGLYATYWTIAQALAKGVDVVVRLNGPRSPVSFAGFRTDNRRVVWLKPARPEWMRRREYQHIPSRLVLRAVRVRITRVGFRTRRVVLITTLTDAEAINGASLADLYRRRWQAELHLRSLKQTLQMDILRGHSPEIVDKEVWAHLLVYNLVRTVMAKAAASESLRPDQISFAGALQSINGFLPHMREAHTAEDSQVLWEVLLWAVAEHRVGNRPDRYEPRAVKRHPKAYPRLTVSRAQARRYMCQKIKSSATKR
jgi:hypothetical protein